MDRSKIFIVAGMPRAGTTSLYHMLQYHPHIYVPFRKETCFFTFQYGKGVDWYSKIFRKMEKNQVGFDISPAYFFDKRAIERIINFNPAAKVILIVRHPVDWIVSFYRLMKSWDYRIPPFENFIEQYDFRFADKSLRLNFNKGLITRMIDEYMKTFGENLLIIDFNLYTSNLLRVLKAIESFVGIPFFFNENNHRNIAMNASNRKNSKVVSNFLSREKINSLFYSIYPEIYPWFPDQLFRVVRKKIDLMRVEKDKPRHDHHSDAKKSDMLYRQFDEDIRIVSSFFKNDSMILGDGKPFNSFSQ